MPFGAMCIQFIWCLCINNKSNQKLNCSRKMLNLNLYLGSNIWSVVIKLKTIWMTQFWNSYRHILQYKHHFINLDNLNNEMCLCIFITISCYSLLLYVLLFLHTYWKTKVNYFPHEQYNISKEWSIYPFIGILNIHK